MKSLKRILFFLVIIVAICILIYIISQNLLKSKSNIKAKSFEELVQFKTNSINDNAKVDSILENLELSKYITKVEKKSADEKLIIYYNCNSEKDVKNYWTNVEKNSIIEKNSVILFSLITNLNIISYNFSGINPEIISNYPYVNGNNREEIIENTKEKGKVIKYAIYLFVTGILLFFIGNKLGDTLENLCNIFNIPQKIIGILLGFVTSIPELITFFEAQKHHKKNNDAILGVVESTNNLLTSNILNLFVIQSIGIVIYSFV